VPDEDQGNVLQLMTDESTFVFRLSVIVIKISGDACCACVEYVFFSVLCLLGIYFLISAT
jgi:hypothetical protein